VGSIFWKTPYIGLASYSVIGVGAGHPRWVERGWGVNILEDARHWIGLLQCNPSTVRDNEKKIAYHLALAQYFQKDI
jgi:hypothetical protein